MCRKENFANLSIVEFDQDNDKGWRSLDQQGKYREAAELIEHFLDHKAGEIRKNRSRRYLYDLSLLYFHLGQLYATIGEESYSAATNCFIKSITIRRNTQWHDYVLGTIMFLQRDELCLNSCLSRLDKYSKKTLMYKNRVEILRRFSVALENGEYRYRMVY